LELRLRELDEIVDVFVIAEANQAHAGPDKPLYLKDNWDRFKPWHHKIKYIMVDLTEIGGVWFRENFQRSTTSQGASGYYDCHVTCLHEQPHSEPRDVIGVFDLDEIPHSSAYEVFDPAKNQCRVPTRTYYYFLNYLQAEEGLWCAGTIFTHEEGMRGTDLNGDVMRKRGVHTYLLDCPAGWHYSFQGGIDAICAKLMAYAHTEHAGIALNPEHIIRCLETGDDLFGRRHRYTAVPVDEALPRTVQEDQGKYAQMLYPPPNGGEAMHPERLAVLPYCLKGKGVDVGCGHRKSSANCIGVDLVAAGQRGSVGCTAGQPSQADIQASGDDLHMFADGELDFVVARHNIEHYVDYVKTLQEWKRVLKTGGHMAVVVPDEDGLRRGGNRTINLDPTHEHSFTMDSFCRVIRLIGGFEVIKCEPVQEDWSFLCVCRRVEERMISAPAAHGGGSGRVFVGIPVLNRIDLLEQCVRSIDYPADIFVVNNNTYDQEFNDRLKAMSRELKFDLYSPRYNLGVAASWNRIVMHGMSLGYDRITISSNDTRLLPGTLAYMEEQVPCGPDDVLWMLGGFNAFRLHTSFIHKVGWFDENFYPAYFEDNDFVRRCELAGAKYYHLPRCNAGTETTMDAPMEIGAVDIESGGGSRTVGSDPVYAKHNRNTFGNWNATHYRMKWGGAPGGEKFTIPYGGGHEFNPSGRDHRWWPDPGWSLKIRDWDEGRERLR